jgi:hypothetical protein
MHITLVQQDVSIAYPAYAEAKPVTVPPLASPLTFLVTLPTCFRERFGWLSTQSTQPWTTGRWLTAPFVTHRTVVAHDASNHCVSDLFTLQAAVTEGRQHGSALSNAVLTQLHLPALPLGSLADIPELRQVAAAKLVQQQTAALAQVAACLDQLQAAVAGLADAGSSIQELADAEAEAPLLAEGPVFASLPLSLLSGMVEDVWRMHEAELAAKEAVVQGFEQILGELPRFCTCS